ncbi:hypothetical protein LSTR_LSTR013223 [Laodelphax striatellus]|uniref:Uncharacterized protein n=1 Tax=Laodelphax striatellus TaxID=195883 RepID=A0A482X643_LAOST|nr:hypothetical protein LSTR_LSTR013223 [Laodelphax striatellus]
MSGRETNNDRPKYKEALAIHLAKVEKDLNDFQVVIHRLNREIILQVEDIGAIKKQITKMEKKNESSKTHAAEYIPSASKPIQDVASKPNTVQDSESKPNSVQDGPEPYVPQPYVPQPSTSKLNQQEVQPVDSLDEDGLKSLLEEAIAYKSPKDKDNSSALFQTLLIDAEKQDESDESDDDGNSAHYQPLGLGRSRYGRPPPRKRLNRRETDRQRGGGSLQNLSLHSSGAKLANRVSVSARQREGGSLPTNVNQSCADDGICNYTSRATLHVSSPVDSPITIPISAAKVTTSVINGIEHTPLQLHSTYNSVKSVVGSDTALKSSENTIQHVSTCFLPISPQQGSVTVLRDTDLRQFATYTKDPGGESKMKSLDENGNALGTTNRVETSATERKTKRKKKNYSKIVNAENIEGHRWDEDIDSLMKYINSGSTEECKTQKSRQSAAGARATVHSKLKSKEEDGRKKKGKELRKIQKSNSMEEISKTKLEDLTSPSEKSPEETNTRVKPKKQVTLDDNQLEASCWQTEETTKVCVSVEKLVIDTDKKKVFEKKESISDLQDADFHLVKKKQRKKKRPANNSRPGGSKSSNYGYHGNQGFPSHYRRSAKVMEERVQPRRKSASSVPPSDKSDSSDLDSVHSLPVSSTTPKPTVGKTSTSGGSTPLASYADITRSMVTPPRAPAPPTPPPPPPPPPPLPAFPPLPSKSAAAPLRKDAMTDTACDKILLPVEEYPPLARKVACGDYFVEFTVKRGRASRDTDVSVEETIIVKTSVPTKKDLSEVSEVKKDVPTSHKLAASEAAAASKRPPVILLNRSGRSSPKHALDVTFGFDINQELLAESDQVPPTTKEPYDHAATVNYIKSEWDEVMRLFNMNARSDRAESKQPQVQYYKP